MAAYPGNPSLPTEVKDRVVSTFRQTVSLFKQGRLDEVLTGCDFLINLDPQFDPAKKLLQKAREPSSKVDVDALLAGLPDPAGDTLAAARAALDQREFERAVELAQDVLETDMTNAAAQQISQEAQTKLEAQPFIDQFIEKARQQRASGNEAAAKATLEKARGLDPANPKLLEYEKSVAAPAQPFDFGAEASPFGSAFSPPPSSEPGPFDFGSFAPPPPEPQPQAGPFEPEAPVPPSRPEPAPASFVVEPSAQAPPATSEASAFGFTFEEDQKAPAPSAGAEAQAIPGTPGEFDFSTASVEVSAEDHSKITKYLAEGDQVFEAGEFQKAIDLWSRIFLLDVTNEEASARIDKARAKRVETDKKVEELVAAGTRLFERGDREGARPKFEEALKLDPTNYTASDYLERLSSGAPAPPPAEVPAAAVPPPGEDLFAEDFSAAEAPAEEAEEAVPRRAPRERAEPEAVAAAPAKRPLLPMALVAVGIVILAAGGWFAFTKLRGGNDAAAASTEATFTEAQSLASGGQYDRAISLLSAIKAEDPQYERALAMIADLQKKRGQGGATQNAAQVYADQLARGRAAFAANDYITAKQAFEQAAAIQPLPPDAKAQYDTASQQVGRTQTALVLFKEGNYREALVTLEGMLQQEPSNQHLRQMISDAHFNLGRTALDEENTQEAIRHFDQVLATNPGDELARRSRELAARYNNERKDLLYRIFVKYLPLRGV